MVQHGWALTYDGAMKQLDPVRTAALTLTLLCACLAANADEPLTMEKVLAAASPSDWRTLDPDNTVYMELGRGRVIIELAADFAPQHVANIKTLITQGYFDGLAILRSQDNYVVQWGDPNASEAGRAKSKGKAKPKLAGEYYREAANLPFNIIQSRDAYAKEVGFSKGFPAGRDSADGRAWLTHCYAMVGAGRDVAPDSGSGAELYAVIGHSPRHLDRNVTLVGRIVQGMELLSTLPRGTGALGFYEAPEQTTPIQSIKMASQVAPEDQTLLELLRTDTKTFANLVQARTHRKEGWFIDSADHIEICNVPLPTRSPSP